MIALKPFPRPTRNERNMTMACRSNTYQEVRQIISEITGNIYLSKSGVFPWRNPLMNLKRIFFTAEIFDAECCTSLVAQLSAEWLIKYRSKPPNRLASPKSSHRKGIMYTVPEIREWWNLFSSKPCFRRGPSSHRCDHACSYPIADYLTGLDSQLRVVLLTAS